MALFRLPAILVIGLILTVDTSCAQTDSWQSLSGLTPDAQILIYLKNGGRMKQKFLSYDQERVVTDAGDVARKDITAISLFRPERLWDGTLRGAAIGVGTLIIPVSAYDDGAAGVAGAGVIGFLGGAGLGALFDAGVAKPDKPIYVGTAKERPSLRKWSVSVASRHLVGWLKRQSAHLMLKDGTYVRGTVVDGTDTSLEIDIRESSRPELKGNARLNTSEIGTVIFRQKLGGSTAAAATGGAISGFWVGAVAGVGASDSANEGPAIVAGALTGALTGGLLSGFGITHMNTREITLVVE